MATRPLHVTVPLDGPGDVMARFGSEPDTWLPGPVTSTSDGYQVQLATGNLLPVPAVVAHVEVGPVVVASTALSMRALSWRAVRLAPAFPVLEADLEVDVRDRPSLHLVGRYNPPLAVVGDVADRLGGHHLVNEVARGFLSGVAHRLASTHDGERHGA